ncbi:sce7726 family protein [Pectobacterium brasiliense]|uniref:sce7726 family protein n=1 Tax=Pectobacterium brasiliense TaxID=180957 RepID=UPI001968CBAA|nr:sce7726 family protein [Pectobacterium brasiliense]MBN3160315.1 sce7726 family protein [Pectobacterium brasiliense]
MLESDIKIKLIKHLQEKGQVSENSILVSELTVGNFSRRVDLVIATQKELIAYEIKSASDNLTRLSGQVEDYLKYFDKVIVVADSRHIKSALQQTPKNVGVWELSHENFIIRRRGTKSSINEKFALASFLTNAELSKLAQINHKKINNFKKDIVIEVTSIKTLRNEVYNCLHRKFSSTSRQFMNKLNSQLELKSSDIELLSIYIPERRAMEKKKSLKSQLWEIWEKELSPSI